MKLTKSSLVGVAVGAAFIVSGCGSDATTATSNLSSFSDLTQLPSASSMMSSSTTSSSSTQRGAFNLDLQAVSGTAPLMTSLSTATAVDAAFWNGMIADINTAGTATTAQASEFWGGTAGGVGGEGACWMAQSVGESVGRMLSSGTSACYMKGMPAAVGAPSDLFAQTAADKIVKVAVVETGGTQNVFIKVKGTNTTGTGVYQAELYFCNAGETTPHGFESWTVNTNTGVYTATGIGSESGGGVHQESLTAYLSNNSAGSVVFDPTKSRVAEAFFYSPSWGTYKGQISISPSSVITARRYNTYDNNGWAGTDKNFSISRYSGSSISDLRFLEASFKGHNINSQNGGQSNSHEYSGSVQYQDTHYKTAATDYDATVAAHTFSSDAWFSAVTAPTVDTSAYDCNATPDTTVSMDFSVAAVAAVKTSCEADRFDNYSMCNGSTIQSAREKIFTRNAQ